MREGTDLTLREFNEIYKMQYNIFLKKASKKDVKSLLYNPYKQNLGLLKYAQNMKRSEFIEFQYQLLESMRSEVFDDFGTSADPDEKYYNMISKMIEHLQILMPKKEKANALP